MTMFLFFLALVLFIIGGLMLIIAMFRVSFWWGMGGLVFAPVQLIFVFKYWNESRSAIVMQTIGLLLILAAAMTGGDKLNSEYKKQLNQYLKSVAPEQMQQLNALQASGVLPTVPDDAAPVVSNQEGEEVTPVSAAPVGNQKVIHKCVDAKGRVAYTEKPCDGAQEKKVITIKNGYDDTPAQSD